MIIGILIFALGGMAIVGGLGSGLTTKSALLSGGAGGIVGMITNGYARIGEIMELAITAQAWGAILLTVGIVVLAVVMLYNIVITGGKTGIQ